MGCGKLDNEVGSERLDFSNFPFLTSKSSLTLQTSHFLLLRNRMLCAKLLIEAPASDGGNYKQTVVVIKFGYMLETPSIQSYQTLKRSGKGEM